LVTIRAGQESRRAGSNGEAWPVQFPDSDRTNWRQIIEMLDLSAWDSAVAPQARSPKTATPIAQPKKRGNQPEA
jgi:hypothetical protein